LLGAGKRSHPPAASMRLDVGDATGRQACRRHEHSTRRIPPTQPSEVWRCLAEQTQRAHTATTGRRRESREECPRLEFTRSLWQRGNYYSRQDAESAVCVSACGSPAASERENFPNRRVPSPTGVPSSVVVGRRGRPEKARYRPWVLAEFYDPVTRTATQSTSARN
jgi:hypothetical protein